MNIVGVIPARMASTRFPGKPLACIHGMPMIGHVYRRAKMSTLLSDVYVATCDNEIADYIKSIGGKAVMTGSHHERCSDRCAEAMLKIEAETEKTVDILMMIQGDEPMISPEMIDQAIQPLVENPQIKISNLMGEIQTEEEFEDPNEVKVITDREGNAIYFSREPIPTRKKGVAKVPMKKQVCLIPFRRDFLLTFNSLPETTLEQIESVDMMRLIEHGYKVKMVPTDCITYAVDTEADLKKAERLMTNDRLLASYCAEL